MCSFECRLIVFSEIARTSEVILQIGIAIEYCKNIKYCIDFHNVDGDGAIFLCLHNSYLRKV